MNFEKIDIGTKSHIVFADNMDKSVGVPSLDNNTISLVFTSPPYWNYKEYESKESIGNKELNYDLYLYSLECVFYELYNKLFPGGRFVINIADMKSRHAIEGKSFLYPLISDTIQIAQKVGFLYFDQIIWNKCVSGGGNLQGGFLFGSYPYPPTPKIYDCIFENILVFTKEGTRDKVSNEIKNKSKLTSKEWRKFTNGIWNIRTDRNSSHPATFPIELAERVIRLYSFVGDIVIDPFSGTGTTVVAAEKWDRIGIGFEISIKYKKAIIDRRDSSLNIQLTLPL